MFPPVPAPRPRARISHPPRSPGRSRPPEPIHPPMIRIRPRSPRRAKGLVLPLLAFALVSAETAQAGLLGTESFSGYPLGELPAAASPAVPGYTGDWTDIDFGNGEPAVLAGSLRYDDPLYLGSSGGRAGVATNALGGEIAAANSGRVFRLLDDSTKVTATTTGTRYLSFLFQSGQELAGSTVYQTLALYDGGTADAARNFDAGLTTNGGQTGTHFNFGADNAYATTGVAADTGVHLFVVKFELGATAAGDTVTVWLDPVLGANDPAGGVTVTGKDITFDRLALSDYDGNSAAWDEIRFGTTFNDVTLAAEPDTTTDPVPGTLDQDATGITLTTPTGLTRVEIWGERVARIRHTPTFTLPSTSSLAVNTSPGPVAWQLHNNGDHLLLTTSQLAVRVETPGGRVSFLDSSSAPVLAESASGTSLSPTIVGGTLPLASHVVRQSFDLASGEAIYGLGQHQSTVMNWVGQSVTLQQKNEYVGVPVMLSNQGYSVLWDNPAVTTVDVGKTTAGKLSWSSEAGDAVDYYFCYGPEPDDAIAGYRALTGAAPMFGKWAWGFWQSKERYQSQQEILDVAAQYRALGIPLDGVVQDWRYWPDLDQNNPATTGWGSHIFDPVRFPDPVGMMNTLHADNIHLIISVWAKFDVTGSGVSIPNLQELEAVNGVFNPAIPYVFPAGQGKWLDPFNSAARSVYWNQLSEKIFSKGVDGWWLDASEAEFSGNWGEFRAFNTGLGPGATVYNAYPLMETTAVAQGHRAESSDKRVFILTRSAYAGQQRNAAVTWSGDIGASWDVFSRQIPSGLNFTATGIPYWNTDIGGFFSGNPATESYAELFTRWFQYGAFNPMFRVHGTNYAKEVWRFPAATQPILIDYINLRYRLMPYIYSQAWKVTDEGYTLMRPLVMDFRADPQVNNINDQFMFGPSLLVNPVTTAGATSRNLYLPAGADWFDFWTGTNHAGGQQISAAAPIQTMPLYVRAGSILPYGPPIQYAMEKVDPIELRVYPGADGSFTLYEDEGDNYDYESGVHATIPFIWDDSARTLTIGARTGSFPGMLAQRTFRVVFVRPGHGAGLVDNTPADLVVTYTGAPLTLEAPPLPEPPVAPAGLVAGSGAQGVRHGDASAGEVIYRVKRATRLDGPYTDLASGLTATSYTDSGVSGGTTYYYVVTAANAGGESPASAPVAAIGGTATLQTLLMFNEATAATSTTTADASGRGRHATLVNGALRSAAGRGGNAIDLDGIDDHLSLPAGVVAGLNNFTVATWVHLDAATSGARVFDFGTGADANMFLTPNGATGVVRFAITTSGAAGQRTIDGAAPLPTGVWTHVAVTSSGGVGVLYVNGVEVGRNESLDLTPLDLGSSTQNWLGRAQSAAPFLDGRLDNFHIYSGALPPADVAALAAGTAHALASPWASQDIGSVGFPGSAGGDASDASALLMTASGADIWDASDNFHYTWQTWTGDAVLVARVERLAATDPWAKAGIMFRESLAANARNALVTLTPANGCSFQTRAANGGASAFTNSATPVAPYWIKLQRTGDTFTASHSPDGVVWTVVGTPVTLALPTTYHVGFALTSHNNTQVTAARFDRISLAAGAPLAPTGLTATAGDGQVFLAWNAAAGATDYDIKRSLTSGGPYTTIASVTGATGHTDTGLTNTTTYHYVVSAVNAAGQSANSAQASATPLSAFQQWLLDNGLPLSLPATAEPDGDGIPLLLKYATGLVPGVPATSAPAELSAVGDALVFRFTRLSPAPVHYTVEASNDLSAWTPIATLSAAGGSWTGPALVEETGAGDTRETAVTDTESLDAGPRRFLRLRVTAP